MFFSAILLKKANDIRWVVEKGADVNMPNTDERTPLHVASSNDYLDAVKFLSKLDAISMCLMYLALSLSYLPIRKVIFQ